MVLDAVGNPQTILLLGGTSEIGLAICERYLRNAPARIVLTDAARRPAPRRRHRADEGGGCQVRRDGSTSTASTPRAIRRSIDAAFTRRVQGYRRRNRRVRLARRRRRAVAEPAQGGADRRDQLHRSGFRRSAGRREDARAGLRPDHRDELGCRRAGAAVQLRIRIHQGRPGRLLPRPWRSAARVRGSGARDQTRAGAHDDDDRSTGKRRAPRKRRFTVDKEYVAELAVTASAKGKELVWAPGAFRYVMMVLRHIPRPIFRKLPI